MTNINANQNFKAGQPFSNQTHQDNDKSDETASPSQFDEKVRYGNISDTGKTGTVSSKTNNKN